LRLYFLKNLLDEYYFLNKKNPPSWSVERGYIPKTDLRKAHLEK